MDTCIMEHDSFILLMLLVTTYLLLYWNFQIWYSIYAFKFELLMNKGYRAISKIFDLGFYILIDKVYLWV